MAIKWRQTLSMLPYNLLLQVYVLSRVRTNRVSLYFKDIALVVATTWERLQTVWRVVSCQKKKKKKKKVQEFEDASLLLLAKQSAIRLRFPLLLFFFFFSLVYVHWRRHAAWTTETELIHSVLSKRSNDTLRGPLFLFSFCLSFFLSFFFFFFLQILVCQCSPRVRRIWWFASEEFCRRGRQTEDLWRREGQRCRWRRRGRGLGYESGPSPADTERTDASLREWS